MYEFYSQADIFVKDVTSILIKFLSRINSPQTSGIIMWFNCALSKLFMIFLSRISLNGINDVKIGDLCLGQKENIPIREEGYLCHYLDEVSCDHTARRR
jgi:hypothetical protein